MTEITEPSPSFFASFFFFNEKNSIYMKMSRRFIIRSSSRRRTDLGSTWPLQQLPPEGPFSVHRLMKPRFLPLHQPHHNHSEVSVTTALRLLGNFR